MSALQFIKNIAIVGSTGNSGSYITKSLLDTGRFHITALTRAESKSKPPAGLKVADIDYNKPETIVAALQGQDALVITLGIGATSDIQEKLIDAAGEAGVAWIMPNEWSPDVTDEGVLSDVPAFQELLRIREYIKKLGKSSYIAQSNGFWYEWSLAIAIAFGFDFEKREATFFDDGATKICTSTWPQTGRAAAAILSLPAKSESGASLDKYRDQNVFVNSFTVSQRDMFQSVLRVTGDKESDWKITKVQARERVAEAGKALQAGDHSAYVTIMYTRIFYDDGNGDYEAKGKLANHELGLPKENLDDATRSAIKRAKEFKW